jgi:hypothetical protein
MGPPRYTPVGDTYELNRAFLFGQSVEVWR